MSPLIMMITIRKVANSGKDQILDLEPEDQGSKRRARLLFLHFVHIRNSQRGEQCCLGEIIVRKKFQVLPGMEAEAVPTTGVEAQQMPPKKVSFFKAKESKFLRPKKVSC